MMARRRLCAYRSPWSSPIPWIKLHFGKRAVCWAPRRQHFRRGNAVRFEISFDHVPPSWNMQQPYRARLLFAILCYRK